MWSQELIEKVFDEYNLKCIKNFKRDINWSCLDNYPHVIVVELSGHYYYLKEIIGDKNKKEWLEKIYTMLNGDTSYVQPYRNIHGHYLTNVCWHGFNNVSPESSEYCYLLTDKMGKIDEQPSPAWWANCLSGIHLKFNLINDSMANLESLIESGLERFLILPSYEDTMVRMRRVSNMMESDVKNLIESFIVPNRDSILNCKVGVPVHGDPLLSNVASRSEIVTLFDFESSGIAIPEYDIQRLFTDYASNCKTVQEIDRFCNDFIDSYEGFGIKIDIDVLDYLFRVDLVRTICWLYEISVSYNRQDHERQSKDLEKYKAALRSGCYHRVLSAIHKTWQYDLKYTRINNQDEILQVAKLISAIVPNFSCVTLGGSRSHFLDDDVSDVEMYFYSETGIPSIDNINRVLENAGAVHRRSSSFLWDEEPWGPHSFFEIYGLYFEIGYRVLKKTKNKLEDYLSGKMVEPQKDCHDLGLGYLFSGLAASVQAEKIILLNGKGFLELQNLVNQFSDTLKASLRTEYLDTAESLIKGKLYVAAQRQDMFFYNVLSTRVIRCLMIMAFSVTCTHFPGDKWNEVLLLHTRWSESKRVLQLLNSHMRMDAKCVEKYNLLLEAYTIVKKSLDEGV